MELDFLPELFFADFFEEDFFELDFFFGTFAPSLRASESPMAMACFRLFTFFPLRPDFSLPRLYSCISRSTDFDAFGPYFRFEDFFRAILCLRARTHEVCAELPS